MQSKEFFEALKALEQEKNIKSEYVIESLEAGLTAAYKKIYGEAKKAKVKLNPEKCTIKIYSYKTVVEQVEDPEKEISLQDARLIKKSYKLGDEVLQEENSKDFGRVPSSTVKHVILQKIREAVRVQEHNQLADKEGKIISLQLMRFDRNTNNYCFNMGGMEVECLLNEKEIIPGERLVPSSFVRLYVKKVVDTSRGVQILASRKHHNFVKCLFELEIPEIQSGEIYVYSVSREAGYRTKIAIASNNSALDVVGTCVGVRGVRLLPIMKELNGEKIDIIPFNSDPAVFITNALSPATVNELKLDEENKSALAIVPDDKLSLAIGKDGINVRLASRLTGWKIDVKSESQINNSEEMIDIADINDEDNSDDDLFGDIEE